MMEIAIIVLSVLVLVLCVALFLCAIKIADLGGSLSSTIEHCRVLEESRCRIQSLVYNKFNYHAPASDKYLSLEELKLEKSNKNSGAPE